MYSPKIKTIIIIISLKKKKKKSKLEKQNQPGKVIIIIRPTKELLCYITT